MREKKMKLSIWGSRGSRSAPSGHSPGKLFKTDEFGGNTTCYLLETKDGKKHIIDAGTGIVGLGLYLAQRKETDKVNLYLTHMHWDHIQGIPFFGPAYMP